MLYFSPQYATDYSRGQHMTYSRLCEIVGWPKRAPLSPVQLIIFERTHEAVDLYLWLRWVHCRYHCVTECCKLCSGTSEKGTLWGLIVLSLVEKLSHQSISMVQQQVSFVERSSLSQRVPYRRFHCTSLLVHTVCGSQSVSWQWRRRESCVRR